MEVITIQKGNIIIPFDYYNGYIDNTLNNYKIQDIQHTMITSKYTSMDNYHNNTNEKTATNIKKPIILCKSFLLYYLAKYQKTNHSLLSFHYWMPPTVP